MKNIVIVVGEVGSGKSILLGALGSDGEGVPVERYDRITFAEAKRVVKEWKRTSNNEDGGFPKSIVLTTYAMSGWDRKRKDFLNVATLFAENCHVYIHAYPTDIPWLLQLLYKRGDLNGKGKDKN